MAVGAPVRAVLFDLDGTLVDSVPDLGAAARRMLLGLGLPAKGDEEIRDYVGKGTAKLVQRCLGVNEGRFEEAMRLFDVAYREESGRHSRLYSGVLEGLDQLRTLGLPLGCVTNKPAEFTLPLLDALDLSRYFSVVVSGDTVARRKPDPMPMLHACDTLRVAPTATLVIGDSANDAQAARAAGCRVLCVPYGYREGLPVNALDCDGIVEDIVAAARYVVATNRH